MVPPERTSDKQAYYSFINPGKMKGWVGLVGWPVADIAHWHITYILAGGVLRLMTEYLDRVDPDDGRKRSRGWLTVIIIIIILLLLFSTKMIKVA